MLGKAALVRAKTLVSRSTSPDRDSHKVFPVHHTLADLQARKIDPYLHQQALYTSTPSGKALFGMRGVRRVRAITIRQERVKSGLKRARAKGKTLGRPRTGSEAEASVRELAANGMGNRKIARTLGIGVRFAKCIPATPRSRRDRHPMAALGLFCRKTRCSSGAATPLWFSGEGLDG